MGARRELVVEVTRARYPDQEGFVERDGVRVFYEVYGHGEPTVLLLPTWSLVHSRVWKAQVAYLARYFRVIAFDGRGNGRSDRPAETAAYHPLEFAHDALAVMDATGTRSAVTVSTSAGTAWNLGLTALAPERVAAAVFLGPTPYVTSDRRPEWMLTPFNEPLASYEGHRRYNRYFIREHFLEFAEYWANVCLPERHSTRPIEIVVQMAMDTTPEVVLATLDVVGIAEAENAGERFAASIDVLRGMASGVRCPVLVIQGELDYVCLPEWARALAEDTGGELLLMPDAGHLPQNRKPVQFNLALREFVERVATG
jgi:pimeloyl-ACP methyl ester carboxylesterase